MNNPRTCLQCPRPVPAKSRTGLCAKCYMRYYRNGKQVVTTPSKREVPPRIPMCHPERPYAANGLCVPCYQRDRRDTLRGRPPSPYRQTPTCGHPNEKHHAHGMCKACYRSSDIRKTQYAKKMKNPTIRQRTQERCRRYKLKSNYNITPEDYEEMFAEQNGVCAICKINRHKSLRLSVDHDNETGRVRRLLCIPCNRAIGYLENREWFAAAKEYLSHHSRLPLDTIGSLVV
jgi:hypothetical protein